MKAEIKTEIDSNDYAIYYSRPINTLVAIPKLEKSKVNYLMKLDNHDERVLGKILKFDQEKKTYVPMNDNSQEFSIKGLEFPNG